MDNGVGTTVGEGVGLGRGGQRGENWDNCNRINKNFKKCFSEHSPHPPFLP